MRLGFAVSVVSLLLAQPAAADPKPSLQAGFTAVYLNETGSTDSDESLSSDLVATLPLSGGVWTMYVEGATATAGDSIFNRYLEINGDSGSAQDVDGGARLQISELNYRFNFANSHELTIGQIDPSAHLDRSRLANNENTDFLGTSFVNNPTIQFPDYALGVLYRLPERDGSPELTAIVTSSNGLADNPRRSYQELVDVGDAGKGAFIGVSARWSRRAARLGLGAWYRSDDHPLLHDATRDSNNYGIFAVYDWQSDRHGYHLRAGAANHNVSAATGFVSAAYVRQIGVGALGLGVGRVFRSTRLDDTTTGDTTHLEAFWRIPLPVATDSHVTITVQHLSNSRFDDTGGVIDDSALVAGLRLHAWFGS